MAKKTKKNTGKTKSGTTAKVIEIKTQKQLVEERLAALYSRNGERITPTLVIDDARDPESPLHTCFEWDDTKAAHEHRLDQARELIRAVPLHVQYEQITLRAPKYVRDQKRSSGYTEMTKLRTDKDAAREVVRAEADRANAALHRAHAVAAVLGLETFLSDLIDRLEEFKKKVS